MTRKPTEPPARRVWILDEGSQGHLVQSRGLVRELGGTTSVEAMEIPIPCALPRRLARSLCKRLLRRFPSMRMFRWLYPQVTLPELRPDLIVSSGPHSLAALVFLSNHCGCPSVFVQGTIRVPEGSVTAILRPFEGEHREDYIFIPLLFTEVTPQALEQAKAEFLATTPLETDAPLNALFIGNSSGKITFTRDDWEQIARFVNDLSRRDGSRWLVTTSSRTGRDLEQWFKQSIDPDSIAHAVWYVESPRKVTKAFLGLADRVFVTMDSLTMLTEAVASRRPVIALCPAEPPDMESNTHLQYIRGLAENGMISLVRPGAGSEAAIERPAGVPPDYSVAIQQLLTRLQWIP